jgi:hypothetical protein
LSKEIVLARRELTQSASPMTSVMVA